MYTDSNFPDQFLLSETVLKHKCRLFPIVVNKELIYIKIGRSPGCLSDKCMGTVYKVQRRKEN